MTIEMKSRHRCLVEAILQSRIPGLRVLAFGSRSRGDSVPHSDLDLLIDGEIPVDDVLLAQLALDFADSDLPFRVGVLDGASLDAAFRRRIAVDLQPIVLHAQEVGGSSVG
jgi:predicted nucleotidyltransferase